MNTETAKPRLIDANALIEEIKDLMDNENEDDEWNKPLKFALKLIDSSPTVETTDDVLARIPKFPQRMDYQCLIFDRGNWVFSNAEFKDNVYKPRDYAYGRTPLEAVKRLEESLKHK